MQSTGLWLYILIILGFQLAESDKNYSNAVRSFRYKQLQAQQLLSRAGIRFKIVKIPSNTVSISPAILSRQVQVKRSRHHDKKGSEWLLLNSQFKKPPEYESHRNYNLNYNRAIYKPRYFHGGLFAPRLPFLSYQQRHGIQQNLSKGHSSCSHPYTAYLGQIQCGRGQGWSRSAKRDASPSSRTKNLRPDFRPRASSQVLVPRQLQHRRAKRQDAALSVQKRGPGCMRRCLEARILHPAQCHSLC